MNGDSETGDGGVSGVGRYVPMLVFAIALLIVLILPLKIFSYGFLPPDDVLADSAKSITGKPWPEILVLRPDYAIDNHIGWHTVLRQIHLWTNCSDESLALFAMGALFVLVGWSALPWLKRPEAWLITLVLTLGIQSPFMRRFMMGRPFLLTITELVTVLFLTSAPWAKEPGKRSCAAVTILIALAVLLHGVWYFWALPVAAFFLARRFHWGIALAGCWVAGTILGAACTGHPVVYIVEAWMQARNAVGLHLSQTTLVTELRPTAGNWFPLLLLGALVVMRQLAKLPCRPLWSEPSFWLAAIGWALGFEAERIWDDWGLPALMVLIALDLDMLLSLRIQAGAVKRIGIAAGLAVVVFVTTTSDADSRWSSSAAMQYLTAEDPRLAGWLPDAGGIFYESDLEFFYHTFFRNPAAPWKYSAGFEPAFMPREDLETYMAILSNGGSPDAYRPWIKKMRPSDRLVLSARGDPTSFLPELEWKYGVGSYWLGRLPRKN